MIFIFLLTSWEERDSSILQNMVQVVEYLRESSDFWSGILYEGYEQLQIIQE